MGSRSVVITGGGFLRVLDKEGDGSRLPFESELVLSRDADIFVFGNYVAVSSSKVDWISTGTRTVPLRDAWRCIGADDFGAAVKGAELVNWSEDTVYCTSDGSLLERTGDISKKCPVCGREYFPALYPAVVVLVTKGDKALLVHAKTFKERVHALVAGFVETGESLEECVAREVKEETSLEITDIRYFGSDSWPFPHQLMIGFTAKWKSGEIVFADGELTAGGFFSREDVPPLPSLPSLSRKIIDAWLEGKAPENRSVKDFLS